MSPEQTQGVRDDPRIDVYALGAILFRMLTGRLYLDFEERETPAAQAQNVLRIQNQPPSAPSKYNRQVPAWLDRIVLRALAKHPDQRWPTADALQAALLEGQSGVGLQVPQTQQRRPHLPAWFWWAAGGAAALLVLIAIVVGIWSLASPPTELPTPAPTGTPTSTPIPPSPTPTLTGVPPTATPTHTPASTDTPTPAPTPTTSGPWFGPPSFCLPSEIDTQNRRCLASHTLFTGQIVRIYVSWPYKNVYRGMKFERRWYRNGQFIHPAPSTWDGVNWRLDGETEYTWFEAGKVLDQTYYPPGDYLVEFYIEGVLVQSGAFTVTR
jgi:serine/threonine protein kinase